MVPKLCYSCRYNNFVIKLEEQKEIMLLVFNWLWNYFPVHIRRGYKKLV